MAVQLLPDELIVQILSILPAKSLLRCRSVCKSWLNLISSTEFKVMHFHNFNQLNPRYFVRRVNYNPNEEWYDVHFDDEAFSFDDSTQIEFPLDSIRVSLGFRIVGCCNGVVCLCDDDDLMKVNFSLDAIILWNPSIRRKLTLPLPMFYSVGGFNKPIVVLGFGYDKISDDFKVLSLTYDQESSTTRPKVEVYTVKTGIWREVMFPGNLHCFHIFSNLSSIFSNGCVHWTAYDPTPGVSRYSIITFDISTELFDEIQLPEFLTKESLMVVSVVGESLAVIHSSDLNGLKSDDFYWIDDRTYVDRYEESLGLLDVGDSVPHKDVVEALMMIEKQGAIRGSIVTVAEQHFHENYLEIEMAIELPDEVIVEILSMLPAKSLIRCRLVCKSWLNLISSTKFKLMHLHNFNQLNPRYFVRRLDYFASKEWFCVHFDDEDFTFDSGTQIEFPFDICRTNLCYRIIGCCNGVVCLCDDDDFFEIDFRLDMIILWNPSVRRKLTLPLPMFHSIGFKNPHVVLGFGYDMMSDDFKVVSLTYDDRPSTTRPKVEVYSVKTGIWRKVMFPNNLRCFYIQSNWSRIFFNGCMHWIAYDPIPGVSHYSIITFDVTTELFGEIALPEFLAEKYLRVCVVGESLAVIPSSELSFDGLKSGSTYTVMVMKEYKNPASWTMLYHVHYPKLELGKPLRLRNNGDMIVELENRDVIIFNHYEGNYVYVFRDCLEEDYVDYRTYVDRYEESLALLDVGDSVPNKEAMEALMMIEMQGMMIEMQGMRL
ncbi:hypothetical protein OSB04_013224 [Centaurea solstitialis]|uniref:F-box domain-containing protein n=1 Tax=Centaurea solstitialis TaxID=347529 RepID=A0AA38TPJ8_9ASTR|nr:hypothetical protein OSB04_013224 [Centaurea solstitialis]